VVKIGISIQLVDAISPVAKAESALSLLPALIKHAERAPQIPLLEELYV
jgi:hypothetical protein